MGPKMAVCIRTLPPTPAQVPAGSWGCRGEVRWEGVQEGIEGHRPLRLPPLVCWHGQTLSFRIRLNTQQMQSHVSLPFPATLSLRFFLRGRSTWQMPPFMLRDQPHAPTPGLLTAPSHFTPVFGSLPVPSDQEGSSVLPGSRMQSGPRHEAGPGHTLWEGERGPEAGCLGSSEGPRFWSAASAAPAGL